MKNPKDYLQDTQDLIEIHKIKGTNLLTSRKRRIQLYMKRLTKPMKMITDLSKTQEDHHQKKIRSQANT